MKKAMLALLLTGLIMVLPTSQIYADSNNHAKWNANANTIEASGIIVMFYERQPQYKFWIPGENDTAVYIVKFLEILEFEDKNLDYNYTTGDVIKARAQLLESSINWNITAMQLQGPEGSNELRVIMSAQVPVRGVTAGLDGVIGYVNVTFVNHIYDRDVDVEGYVVEGNYELKIDIIIQDWPWTESDTQLALGIIFAGHFRGHTGVPSMHKARVREKVKEMRMSSPDASYEAAFRYREEVKVKEQVKERLCGVNASEQFSHQSALMYLTYPHFEGIMIHDPSIIVFSPELGILGQLQLYAPYILIGAVVVIGIVLVARKK